MVETESPSISSQIEFFLSSTLLESVHQVEPSWGHPPRISFHLDNRLKLGFASSSIAMELASFLDTPKPKIMAVASEIAQQLTSHFNDQLLSLKESQPVAKWVLKAISTRGFINFVCSSQYFQVILSTISLQKENFGRQKLLSADKKLMIEHTSVNPNKPWHIGHMRNAIIGDTLGRMFRQLGQKVEIQNYIDDTGTQVAEAIWYLKKNKEESADKRFDIWLGEKYVKGQNELEKIKTSEESAIKVFEKEIYELGEELEAGKHRQIIEKCVKGQLEDAYRLDIYYDLLSWESDIFKAGIFEQAMDLLKASPYVSHHETGEKKGCVVLDIKRYMDEKPRDEVHAFFENLKDPDKILIRSNGLPTYVAKDIAYMLWKYGLVSDMKYRLFEEQPNKKELWTSDMSKGVSKSDYGHADRVINVIGSEQTHSQKIVHLALKICGYSEEHSKAHHMAYAHVTLKDGRMSGRKGFVESSYEILDIACGKAKEILKSNHPEYSEEELNKKAEAIGNSAVRYAMISQSPSREILFEWEKILRLDGDSAPYLQYSYVRALKILERLDESREIDETAFDPSQVKQLEEKMLLIQLLNFQVQLRNGCDKLDPTEITNYAIMVGTTFNKFYEKCSIIRAETEAIKKIRLEIVKATIQVLENVFKTLGIQLVDEL